jgi:hypothetical protein
MPIFKNTTFGKHKEVLYIEFGSGDIRFTKANEVTEDFSSILYFNQNAEPRQIGEIDNEDLGKTTQQVGYDIKLAFKFRRKESIAALMESLKEMYDGFPEGVELESQIIELSKEEEENTK